MKKAQNKEIIVMIFIIALLIIVLIFSGVFYFKVFSGIMAGHIIYNEEKIQNQDSAVSPQQNLNENTELLSASNGNPEK